MQKSRKEAYLDKAKEAEKNAERMHDPQAKETWLTIAENYRELARVLVR